MQTNNEVGQWVQTDGSDGTLQYGRRINSTTWEYRQWVDHPYSKGERLTADEKTARWDSVEWEIDVIDLKDYNLIEVREALVSFGYSIYEVEPLRIEQNGHIFSLYESVQLACESIFEVEMF